ncbi:MAG: GAF domain-containing protein [Anaerolineales bacterium]|nr:GAF domain-containing protein [Anaerolineales bacterium]
MEARQRLPLARGSLFYKILLVLILLSILPSLLLSLRLLTLNYSLLQDIEQSLAAEEGLALEANIQGISSRITSQLTSEAAAYMLYLFLTIAIIAIFTCGGLIQPIHKLAQLMARFRKGEIKTVEELQTEPAADTSVSASDDEVKQLDILFKRLATELLDLQYNLENQVTERTQVLEHHAHQMQAAAAVAEAAASIRNMDELLSRVAELISHHFGYYHAGIFLMDAEGENAILRAANSPGGKKMLQQGHSLPRGETSIVGYVANTREARLALDVGKDAVHFRNPFLPQTRSEIALPLIAGAQLWGILDVQSTEEAAFDEDDIATLQTLANQVAIAIENANLFVKNQFALKELQDALEMSRRIYSGLTQEAWRKLLQARADLGYICTTGVPDRSMQSKASLPTDRKKGRQASEVVTPVSGQWKPEMIQASRAGKTVLAEDHNTAAVPIKIRDQVTGVVRLRKPRDAGQWTEKELDLMEALSDRLGTALESARLYEETRRRAERERLTGEITARLRASNDPQTILKTAVSELRKALQADQAQLLLQPLELAQAHEMDNDPSALEHPSDEDPGGTEDRRRPATPPSET